jgi:undecaprenyl pyrophosphate synthase
VPVRSSTEDVVQAVDAVQAGVADGSLAPADVTTELLDECLRTCGCPPVDLLVGRGGA